ncbi:MAG: signal peptidase II [Beijerinckiaceae bacterium]|nr:signal peptidase II [Beijerinckiaceae bacterium]
MGLSGLSPRALGLWAGGLILLADQTHKHWMLFVYEIAARQPVRVTPFFDLVMAWNPGISYSLFSTQTQSGRLMLLGVTLAITALLAVWLWRAADKLTGLALGLIVGGALGNAWDRYAYGAVADFFHFFVDTERWGRVSWYVFNVADVAIVAGVGLLLYQSVFDGSGDGDRSAEKMAGDVSALPPNRQDTKAG